MRIKWFYLRKRVIGALCHLITYKQYLLRRFVGLVIFVRLMCRHSHPPLHRGLGSPNMKFSLPPLLVVRVRRRDFWLIYLLQWFATVPGLTRRTWSEFHLINWLIIILYPLHLIANYQVAQSAGSSLKRAFFRHFFTHTCISDLSIYRRCIAHIRKFASCIAILNALFPHCSPYLCLFIWFLKFRLTDTILATSRRLIRSFKLSSLHEWWKWAFVSLGQQLCRQSQSRYLLECFTLVTTKTALCS